MDTSHWDIEYAILREKFVRGLGARMELVSEQFTLKNWDKTARLAHQMKGAAASYGFKALASAANELEEIAKTSDETKIKPLIERVASEIELSRSLLH